MSLNKECHCSFKLLNDCLHIAATVVEDSDINLRHLAALIDNPFGFYPDK